MPPLVLWLLCKQMTKFGCVLLLLRQQADIIVLFSLMLLTIHRDLRLEKRWTLHVKSVNGDKLLVFNRN